MRRIIYGETVGGHSVFDHSKTVMFRDPDGTERMLDAHYIEVRDTKESTLLLITAAEAGILGSLLTGLSEALLPEEAEVEEAEAQEIAPQVAPRFRDE